MIRLPNLDDQNYSDIVEAAKRRIPVIFPEWTDFNEHDPGITVLEVFAWLKEMQQYYLNRITDRSREDMLRLIGVELKKPAPAKTRVSFRGEAPEFVPADTPLFTSEGIALVTSEDFVKPSFKIEDIYIFNGESMIDVTGLLSEKSGSLFPFGKTISAIGRELYVRLSCKTENAALLFDIPDEPGVKRNRPTEGSVPPRTLVWEYGAAEGFMPCSSVRDGTFALSFGGEIDLQLGGDFSESDYGGRLPKGYWIRARLTDCGCEDMPQLSWIFCGGLKVEQKKRLCRFRDFRAESSGRIEIFGADTDNTLVFVRDIHGWDHCADAKTGKDYVDISGSVIAPSEDGENNVRVIIFDKDYSGRSMFFSSDGLPDQRFVFDPEEGVICRELRVMVRDRDSDAAPRWREYGYTENLSSAGPYDRCFSYDRERREIIFGDNEKGEVPPRGDDGIMVYNCSVTQGAAGNIMAGNITSLSLADTEYELLQTEDCTGGCDSESVYQAISRVSLLLGECTRAVTAEDYRRAALSTPGLRIADAAAIPFFHLQSCEISELKAPNSVTLVVMPFSDERFPQPDRRFLSAVREHLENYRLVTTEVMVTAPIYIGLDISAELICAAREVDKVIRRVREELSEMFSVYGRDGRTRFGEPVFNDSVISRICGVDGILSVKNLRVSTDSTLCRREAGKLTVPANAVTYARNIILETAES